jgi:CHAT domain-containing protein
MIKVGSVLIIPVVLILFGAISAVANESHPDLKTTEQLYRKDGPEIALPRFESLAERFAAENRKSDEAMAVHFIGECHWRMGNFEESRPFLMTALAMREELDDPLGQGKTLNVLGLLEWDLGNYDQAIARFRSASTIGEQIGDNKLAGATLNNLSLVYDELGDYKTSLAQYEQVIELYKDADFPRGEGDTYANIGGVYFLLGQYRLALSYYEKALAINSDLDSTISMSQDHGSIGQANLELGNIDLAIEHFDIAIELAEKSGMRQDAAYYQRAKGNAFIRQGRFDTGLDIHRLALKAYEDIGGRSELQGALHDMGQLHLSLGDATSAEKYFQQSAGIAREIGHANGVTVSLLALGDLNLRREQYGDSASYYNQAYLRASQSGAQSLLASGLLGLAHVHQALERYDEASHEVERALAVAREIGAKQQEAEALYVLAINKRQIGALAQSLDLFEAAETILIDTGDPDLLWQIYFGRAKVLELRGNKLAAINFLQQSVVLIESVRSRLREERFRAGYLQDKYQVYVELVRLQLELDMTEDAFQTAERLRARSYARQFERAAYPVLNENQQRREKELRERVRQLQRALGDEQQQDRRQAALQTFSTELVLAEREYQAFIDDHAQTTTARGASAPIPTSSQVSKNLGDGDLLVEYVVGDDEVMIFALSHGGLFAVVESIRQVDLRARVELLRDLISRPGDSRWRKPAESISDVLISPLKAAGITDGVNNIFLVPHGILNYLPFSVLPIRPLDANRLLIDDFTLAYLPTAVALGDARSSDRGVSTMLAVAPASSRLRYAPDEARSISALFEPNSQLLIGDAATESQFKTIAGDFRMLHLATHSDFNKLNPMFSGLQLEMDDDNDGRLEVHEILRLELNADLVTLSACDTALGSGYFTEIPAGDEFVGLTRAFLSVGSDSVMATLWQVDDRSSVQLMQQFYERLEDPDAGADTSAALMMAQKQLRSTKGYEHPYYWAPFVVVGKISNTSKTTMKALETAL